MNVSKNRITLIIAHRLSTIRHANHIIVLNHGGVVETSNHKQLMNRSGYYAKLIQATKENTELLA